MKPVFIIADNIVSPIALTANENFDLLKAGVSGIQLHHTTIAPEPFYAALFNEDAGFTASVNNADAYTKFERLLITSVQDALSLAPVDCAGKRTVLIISSTKGNISLIEKEPFNADVKRRVGLPASARAVADYFHFTTNPVVVSHACISGLVALITGMRLLQSGRFDHAVVAGADIITQFILSGFRSFHAISNAPCKPFDAQRNGITLGEAAATVVLSVEKPQTKNYIRLSGGAVSNDANHISGPSRTGEELHYAIEAAVKEAGMAKSAIDFISAHGTATIYNDEMEAKAIQLSGLQQVPVNSLKGYYGHTLGAAGLIETVASAHSLKANMILPTPGFETPGTTVPLHINKVLQTGIYGACLKTASGFGGCNAAIVLQKAI
ncbi:beta-ketoacyl-[acyl-carrier-protein] synthase family protein [Agriterribacter sp.]|uniref:beta-ketoacyl-[acyl-carrier-protein] synthase family protein n=1 Tax=Agriterribacter sp. TaxID=2821509 RepID=UPI002D14CF41|nr:beta-ketoacyl synthase N-terminal-like domain-containing protein [Agriterribacter sp.]HTN05838.1 beta-ketoacyl synthase N-terminal-like domain-containing protein [Agriterribacter sp.]